MPNERVAGFLQLLGSNAIGKVCWALTMLVLVRKLGTDQFGILATLWSAATIASGCVDLGTGQVVLREGARDHAQARPLATKSLRLQILLLLVFTAALSVGGWIVLPIAGLSPTERALVIVLAIATPLVDRFQAFFTVCSQLGGNFTIYTRLRSVYFFALLCALALAALSNGGIVSISVIYFSITTSFALFAAWGTWPLLPPAQPTSRRISTIECIREGLPFLNVLALTLAYGRIEVSILGAWGYTAVAGAYHIVYQITLVAYSVSGIFFTVVYPRLYRHKGDPAALAVDFRDTARWLSLLAWLATPPLLLFAAPLLRLFGGADLEAFAPLLRILSLLILLAPASAGLNFLMPLDIIRARIASDLLGVTITTIGAVWAAMTGQPLLAALAAVIGYVCTVTAGQIALQRRLANTASALVKEFLGAGVQIVPAAALSWFMPGPWWLRAIIFYVACIILLVAFRHPIVGRARDLRASSWF